MAADYEPSPPETNRFFSIIQNKLHFATTGHTAAELIAQRADHTLPNMGLTSWARDEVRKTDVTIAKNYLAGTEITDLNRIVAKWLNFAEDQATRRRRMKKLRPNTNTSRHADARKKDGVIASTASKAYTPGCTTSAHTSRSPAA